MDVGDLSDEVITFLESIFCPVILLDEQEKVFFANENALSRYSKSDLIGKTLAEIPHKNFNDKEVRVGPKKNQGVDFCRKKRSS